MRAYWIDIGLNLGKMVGSNIKHNHCLTSTLGLPKMQIFNQIALFEIEIPYFCIYEILIKS